MLTPRNCHWLRLTGLTLLLATLGSRPAPAGEAPEPERIALALEWTLADGGAGKQVMARTTLAEAQAGLWVVFEKESEDLWPGVCFDGEFTRTGIPAGKMQSLSLAVTVGPGGAARVHRAVLFAADRDLGVRAPAEGNVYHLLVRDDFIDTEELPDAPGGEKLPAAAQERWQAPFWRTRRLALNYLQRSDRKTREYAEGFGVMPRFDRPRLVLATEEWIDVPKEVQEKPKPAGPFGRLADALGDTKVVPERVPVYGLDVLADEVEAEGRYAAGFQTARSLWNDILEGHVLYQAAAGKRRVVTASVVFGQLYRNREDAKPGQENRLLTVDAGTLDRLDGCQELTDGPRAQITSFLEAHPDWQVRVPSQPVTFLESGEPIYSLYAWFQVHPASGRMVGVLPTGQRGAFTDELARLGGAAMDKAREAIEKEAGGEAKGFFSQIAGMYVAAAGILDGIAMTIADPSLQDENWMQFLAQHAIDHCAKFLEDNADQYDAYSAQLGFWQGAMVLIGGIGGPDAMKECARRAMEGMANKAINEARKKAEEVAGQGREAVNEALDQALENAAPDLKRAGDGIRDAHDAWNKGSELGTQAGDAYNRYRDAVNDLRQ